MTKFCLLIMGLLHMIKEEVRGICGAYHLARKNMDILVKCQVEQIFFRKLSLEIIDCLQK